MISVVEKGNIKIIIFPEGVVYLQVQVVVVVIVRYTLSLNSQRYSEEWTFWS